MLSRLHKLIFIIFLKQWARLKKHSLHLTVVPFSRFLNRRGSTTALLYALPLLLLLFFTSEKGTHKLNHNLAKKVAEIYEDDHIIIAFVIST